MTNPVSTDTPFADEAFTDEDFSGMLFTNSTFGNCTFTRCNLSGANLVNTRMNGETSFYDCNIAGADFGAAEVDGGAFEDCNLTGVKFNSGRLTDIHFSCSLFKGVALNEAYFDSCDFTGCDLATLDFSTTVLFKSIIADNTVFGLPIGPVVSNVPASFDVPASRRTVGDLFGVMRFETLIREIRGVEPVTIVRDGVRWVGNEELPAGEASYTVYWEVLQSPGSSTSRVHETVKAELRLKVYR